MAAWHQLIRFVRRRRVPSRLRFIWPADFPLRPPYTLGLPLPTGSQPSLLRPSIAPIREYRNINLLSIDYAFRPRLRSRLTLGGRAFPRNPWTFGGRDSHSSFATHAYILTRMPSTAGFRRRFVGHSTLPYHSHPLDRSRRCRCESAVSVHDLSPVTSSARDHSTSELLRTL